MICTNCKIDKSEQEFTPRKNRAKGRASWCKSCYAVKQRNYNKGRGLTTRYQRLYGITEDDYNDMAERQANRCAICSTHINDLSRKFDVDHCHDTGKVRGLLCSACNKGIAFLSASDILRKAADYLDEHGRS